MSKVKSKGHQGQISSQLKIHCNAFAVNNVTQQQTGLGGRCRGWWERKDACGLCLVKHF